MSEMYWSKQGLAFSSGFRDELAKLGMWPFSKKPPTQPSAPLPESTSPQTVQTVNTAHKKATKNWEGYHQRMGDRMKRLESISNRMKQMRKP